MLGKRVPVLLSLLVIFLFAMAVSTVYIFDADIPGLGTAQEARVGPLRMVLPLLRDATASAALPAPPGQSSETREFNWRDGEAQRIFGPVRVVALWSDDPPRSWVRVGSVCSFLLSHYGEIDGFEGVPGFTSMNFKQMHICQVVSRDDKRLGLYIFNLPTPRCQRHALVFARVPWHFAEPTEDQEAINQLMEELKPKIFNMLSIVEIEAGADCQPAMRELAWAAVAVPLAVLLAAGILIRVIWRRSI